MFKAVIFDVDGTLVDTVDLHAKAWQDTFREFGRDVPYADIRHQIGKGSDQIIPVFFSPEEVDKWGDRMSERRHEIYRNQYFDQVTGFPNVRELLERVKNDGKHIVLASSARQNSLQDYIKLLQIEDLVDHVTCKEDAEHSKPAPDIFIAALDRLDGIEPNEAIVVGDTPYDAEAASKINVPAIGMLCGGFEIDELRSAGCVAIYRDPADLLERYAESPLAVSGKRRI